jgi:hypothetical protein
LRYGTWRRLTKNAEQNGQTLLPLRGIEPI